MQATIHNWHFPPKYFLYIFLCLALTIGSSSVGAQSADVKTLYVAVLDKNQNPVADLKREDFSASENGHPLEIVSISSVSSAPLLVGFVVDSSGSAGQNLQRGKELDVLHRFLPNMLTASDKAFVAAFNDETFHLTAVTGNISELQHGLQKLADTVPRGSTALYDALIDAIKVMSKDGAARKVIFCVGDFEDNVSEHTLEKTVEYVRNSGVAVFPLVEYDSYERNRHPRETERGLKAADLIASESGGFVSTFESPAELQTEFEKVRQILRNSYTLEYKAAPSDHSSKKNLRPPKITVLGRKDVAVLSSVSASQ